MKIKWFSHSTFLITTDSGLRIITDPYAYNFRNEDTPPWPKEPTGVTEYADVVVITHAHFDHSYIMSIKGVPQLYTGGNPAEIKGVKFSSVVAHHGANRGYVNLIGIEADSIRLRHLSDMGKRKLTDEQLAQIGKVDVLLTSWDDDDVTMTFTLLDEVLAQLKPKVVIPMHHVKVNEFMTERKGFSKLDTSEMEFKPDTLPSEMKVILLKGAEEMGGPG